MPAAAVASRTPSTGGISGKDAGASGEMLVDMFVIPGHATDLGDRPCSLENP